MNEHKTNGTISTKLHRFPSSRHVTKRVLHEEYFNYTEYFNNRIQQYLWVLVFSFALN